MDGLQTVQTEVFPAHLPSSLQEKTSKMSVKNRGISSFQSKISLDTGLAIPPLVNLFKACEKVSFAMI